MRGNERNFPVFASSTGVLFFFALIVTSLALSSPALGDDQARREYEEQMRREEELIGYESQSMFAPKGGIGGWDQFEQDEINRASGMDVPPLPPRSVTDMEGWSNFIKRSELHRIRERKAQIRERAFERGGEGSTPAPRPSPKPKPEYGPFPEGDPRNNPAQKKGPPPGVGRYGPEPLPAEDPNQLQANKPPLQFDGLLARMLTGPSSAGPKVFQDKSFAQGGSPSDASSSTPSAEYVK